MCNKLRGVDPVTGLGFPDSIRGAIDDRERMARRRQRHARMEPPDLWERYIAAEWRHAALIGLSELHRDMFEVFVRRLPVAPRAPDRSSGGEDAA